MNYENKMIDENARILKTYRRLSTWTKPALWMYLRNKNYSMNIARRTDNVNKTSLGH